MFGRIFGSAPAPAPAPPRAPPPGFVAARAPVSATAWRKEGWQPDLGPLIKGEYGRSDYYEPWNGETYEWRGPEPPGGRPPKPPPSPRILAEKARNAEHAEAMRAFDSAKEDADEAHKACVAHCKSEREARMEPHQRTMNAAVAKRFHRGGSRKTQKRQRQRQRQRQKRIRKSRKSYRRV